MKRFVARLLPLLVLTLAACGIKGPLTLPNPPGNEPTTGKSGPNAR
ncbi:LPS translocon maturation chaperone LptM [Hydrogenophilus islandicus]